LLISSFCCESLVAANRAGLVAAYAFDEGQGTTVFDFSGNGNGGLVSNPNWTVGRYGGALLFNGTDALVTVAHSPPLNLGSGMTLEAWVNPARLSTDWADVIYKANDAYYLEASSAAGPPAVGGRSLATPLLAPNVLPAGIWSHLAATYDGITLRLYLNGTQVASRSQSGTIESSTEPLTIGGDNIYGQFFQGVIDEVRIYSRALTPAEIQSDMATPVSDLPPDTQPPTVSIMSPQSGAVLSGITNLLAMASDNQVLAAVDWRLDGNSIGAVFSEPYSLRWNSNIASNGVHTLTAVAIDAAGNRATSAPVTLTLFNPVFVNEVVVPDIVSATTLAFLPDGRMLVGELIEKIWIVQPGANRPDPTPALILNRNNLFDEQGIQDMAIDPAFSENHYIYVFYTHGSSNGDNRNRVSRFTLNGNTIPPASEFVLWQDVTAASGEHHGGALAFGLDGKLYFTVGDQFNADEAQRMDTYHGKLLRINPDGSIPADNPFYDGDGPNLDEIWALGLRNPYRMSVDPVTGRLFIGDVGANDNATSIEEINLGARGANYGWPLCEGNCSRPGMTNPLFSYPHAGRDACVTAGFVYRGEQFPSEYQGNFFFADYVQNWIKRLVLDTNGNVLEVINFVPPDGIKDGPYGDPVKLVQAPDGSLFYIDLGFNDSHVPNEAGIRRIRYVADNLPPVASVSVNPSSGAAPLAVSFSSVGSSDPEGAPLTYEWSFDDGTSSTDPNPTHTYTSPGEFHARLRLSDGVNSTLSSNLTVTVGGRPLPTILSPRDGITFRGGDVIQYTGVASDPEDGQLPPSAFSWTILFHHEGHIHPGGTITNTSSGTLLIPTTGHDFQGATSYEIILSVTDSDGLKGSTSVTIYPEKVNLFFETDPNGLYIDVAGIRKTAPFIIDALIGFEYEISAPQQSQNGAAYQFLSWSDAGAADHTVIVPETDYNFVALYEVPVFLSVERLAGRMRLHFAGTVGRAYRVEASTNLRNWNTIGNATATGNGTFEFEESTGVSQRFYRCVTP